MDHNSDIACTQAMADIDVAGVDGVIKTAEDVLAIAEADRDDDQNIDLDQAIQHIQTKMAETLFVETLSTTQANRIAALSL